jgi:hypothetical protein
MGHGGMRMTENEKKGFFRAFWDFFVLFSGISTASNLSRTRKMPVRGRGLFLFRRPEKRDDSEPPAHR